MQWATLPAELWPLEYADKRGNEGEKIKWMYNKEFITLEEKQGFVQPCISQIHGRDLFFENTWTMKGLFAEIKILRLTVLLTLNLTIENSSFQCWEQVCGKTRKYKSRTCPPIKDHSLKRPDPCVTSLEPNHWTESTNQKEAWIEVLSLCIPEQEEPRSGEGLVGPGRQHTKLAPLSFIYLCTECIYSVNTRVVTGSSSYYYLWMYMLA